MCGVIFSNYLYLFISLIIKKQTYKMYRCMMHLCLYLCLHFYHVSNMVLSFCTGMCSVHFHHNPFASVHLHSTSAIFAVRTSCSPQSMLFSRCIALFHSFLLMKDQINIWVFLSPCTIIYILGIYKHEELLNCDFFLFFTNIYFIFLSL